MTVIYFTKVNTMAILLRSMQEHSDSYLCLQWSCACLLCLRQHKHTLRCLHFSAVWAMRAAGTCLRAKPSADLPTCPSRTHTHSTNTYNGAHRGGWPTRADKNIGCSRLRQQTTETYKHRGVEMRGMLGSLDMRKWHMLHLCFSAPSVTNHLWVDQH